MVEVLLSKFHLFVVGKLAKRVKSDFDGFEANEFVRNLHEIFTGRKHSGVGRIPAFSLPAYGFTIFNIDFSFSISI